MNEFGEHNFRAAEWGPRAGALILDRLVMLVVVIPTAVSAAIHPALAVLVAIGGFCWYIWLFGYKQGETGLTPGKKALGIKLIHIEKGVPPSGAVGIGRLIVAAILGAMTFYIYFLLDYLWPLWDDKNQRLTDKMFVTQVVVDE